MVQREHCKGWGHGEMTMMCLYLVGNWCNFGQSVNSLSHLFIFLVVPNTERCWCSLVQKLSLGDVSWGAFFFSFKKMKKTLVYYCGWPKERSCTAQHSLKPVRIMQLCVLWYLSFQLPGDGQELIWRENGELSREEDKVQHLLVAASYPGTLVALPALKLGLFAVKLNFKSTQCGLGSLHSGVSRTLELYLKGIVLMFCVFLSDSSNTRGFGIILDLEQSLSALFIFICSIDSRPVSVPTARNSQQLPWLVHDYSRFLLCKWQQNCSFACICFASSADWFNLGILWIALAFLCTLEK